ncbi:MAG: DUF4340 domain-containing protein [Chromatiales bacterium]|nr:DUF4340 domain-containing protein [Chromatiales bacterium]
MNIKKLSALLGLALGILALAWWQAAQRGASEGLHSGELMLPGLREQINDVTGLIIQQSEGEKVSIRLNNGQWQLEEKQGYPADGGKIRSALLILADAKILEEKTSRPEMYSRLGVQDPGTPDAQNLSVTVELGEARRDLIIGKSAMGNSHYVRRGGEAVSLLVNQSLAVEANAMKWLQTGILDIGAKQISRINIQHAGGDTLTIIRLEDSGDNFIIQDMPDGREPISEFAANGIASSLARLNFEDVRRRQDSELAGSTSIAVTTRDGLLISLSLQPGSPGWARFSFSQAMPGQNEEIEQQVRDYSARLQDWEFALPGRRADQLRQHLDDLLKPLN